jgi:hypothetical protein
MIRDVVIHLLNEQPLVADLPAMPSPGDVTLQCTNLRTMSRKRPVFVDDLAATIIVPYAQIRFLEIPPATPASAEIEQAPALAASVPEDLELDEELLRRVREL